MFIASTTQVFHLDELIKLVAQRAGITSEQATRAVSAILAYLTARLPSSVVGRIREQLEEAQPPHKPESGKGDAQ